MAKVYAFLAPGSEEVECLAVVDVLIRGGVDVELVSVTDQLEVAGAHKIVIRADHLFTGICPADADVLFIPGGLPGTVNLSKHEGLCNALKAAAADGRRVAAICAAPGVLGQLGILKGKKATCYPGFEEQLAGAEYTRQGVVTDGNITTARGLGYALDLGIELLRLLTGEEHASEIKAAIQYDQV